MVRHFTVIAYDISSNRKRGKAAKLLVQYGQRANKSVFECFIDDKQLSEIKEKLKTLISPAGDSVLFYRLCKDCLERIDYLGAVMSLPGMVVKV